MEVGIYHRHFGRAAPELGWVPSPMYLLRRDRVLRTIRSIPTGRILEIGCGAGALIEDLSRLGFECEALESSPEALSIARTMLTSWDNLRLHNAPEAGWTGRFDAVLALEVLEHIENDLAALSLWTSYLKPNGSVIISVPARMSRWGADDEWAGHFRRYDRVQLLHLFGAAGLQVSRIESYGFPVGNLARFFRRRVRAAQSDANPSVIADRTARSGIERGTEIRLWPLLSSLPGVLAMHGGMILQQLFLKHDLGDGYLVVGYRK